MNGVKLVFRNFQNILTFLVSEDRDHSYGSFPLCHVIRHNTRNKKQYGYRVVSQEFLKIIRLSRFRGVEIPTYSQDLYTI